jgi:multicomponent Na+:H+ antiporter subunit G
MIVNTLLLVGALFVLVAALGVVRLPDLLMRMHAATKAGTLGAGLLLIAIAVSSPETSVVARAVATIVFLLLTAPVAAHLIARAAYYTGEAALWEHTCVDELATAIDEGTPAAESPRPAEGAPEWGAVPRPTEAPSANRPTDA